MDRKDERGDVGEGQQRRAPEKLEELQRATDDIGDPVPRAPDDREDPLAQQPASGRQQEQQSGEGKDRGQPHEHGLPRGQEMGRAKAAAPGPHKEDGRQAEMGYQAT